MPKQTITPGPWTINGNSIVTERPANIGICKMYGNIGQPVPANAQAIAAVPDMIEALRSMIECNAGFAREQARAALRKAGQIE